MRAVSFPLILAVAVVAGACHREPAEEVASFDAGVARAGWFDRPLRDGASAAIVDAGAGPDGGRADVRIFCDDAFSADNSRLLQKCRASELGLLHGMKHAAANLCNDDVNAAIARSRTSFDPDAAKQCVQMLQDRDLSQSSEADTLFQHFPCDQVLVGIQAAGQPCRFSIECKDSLACVGYGVGTDGTCRKPPKAGEACTMQRFGTIVSEAAAAMHHPECAPDAWCDGKTCQRRVGKGKTCEDGTACSGGLSCVMGKCGKRGDAGSTCFHSTDCVFGLWCDKPATATTGRCEAKRPEGAECPEPAACRGRCDRPQQAPDAGLSAAPGRCVSVCGSG